LHKKARWRAGMLTWPGELWARPCRMCAGFLGTTFFGDAKRADIFRVDEANHPGRAQLRRHRNHGVFGICGGGRQSETRISPNDRSTNGLGGIALAMMTRCQNPAKFGHAAQRRLDLAFPIRESHLTYKLARVLLLDDPITKAHPSPMTDVAQQTGPDFFLGERPASDVPRDVGIAPKSRGVSEIAGAMSAQAKARGFEHRHFPAA